jgi:hypothetical protein
LTPSLAQIGDISVALKSLDYSFPVNGSLKLSFRFVKQPIFNSASSYGGPTRGKSSIIIFGEKFYYSKFITCMFGNKRVAAQFSSSTEIECLSPSHDARIYDLSISFDGSHFYGTGNVYEFFQSFEIFEILPTFGPSNGATYVKVSGSGFYDMKGWNCVFGDTRSQTTMACLSPQGISGSIDFRVSDPEGTFAETILHFRVEEPLIIDKVIPNLCPTAGGTLIKVFLLNFIPDDEYICYFGSIEMSSAITEHTHIFCPCPSNATEGQVTLTVRTVQNYIYSFDEGTTIFSINSLLLILFIQVLSSTMPPRKRILL